MQAEKMKAKFFQQLNNSVTHQICVPLDQAITYCQKMVISPLLNYKVKPMLMKVMIGQKMAKLMTNDLLDHHMIERKVFEPKMETCNIFSIIKEVLFLMGDEAKNKDITIVEDMSDQVKLECIADSQRIQQVLINIFQNAIKFSSRNTQITLQANIATTRKAGSIQNLNSIETKDTLKVKIIDNGPGITDDILKRVFQPYVNGAYGIREKSARGLGLSISNQICKELGGDLRIKSQPGMGTQVSFSVKVKILRNSNTFSGKDQKLYYSYLMEHSNDLAKEKQVDDYLKEKDKN